MHFQICSKKNIKHLPK